MAEKTPKYRKVIDWVEEEIKEGRLRPGEKLYSEKELGEMFRMSRQTVRHALEILEQDGIISRQRGSGTYINENRIEYLAKRKQIGIITTYLDNYIFPGIIKGIEDILYKKDYAAQISFTNNSWARERNILESTLERDDVAGMIIETTKSGLPNPNLHLYQELLKRKIPVLFFNCSYPELNIPHVSMNDVQAGYEAAKLLIDKGHRKIGGVFKLDDGQGHRRYKGYLQAMLERGLEAPDKHVVWIDTEDLKNIRLIMDKVVSRLKDRTAFVSYNDEVTFALMEQFKERGIRIPEDISVASIDNSELSLIGEIKLSSVPHPMDELGKTAARNIIKMIEDPHFDGNYEFDVHVIDRDSVKKI